MSKLPHIIIFNPDQWRSDVMGHMGNPAAVTPNLDKFVEDDAVSFRNAFCQNTVCTPSRCSFMTGWYPHVRGHRTMYHMLHPERDEPNLLKILKDKGYFVWWGGKNDLTPGQEPVDQYCDVKFQATDEDRKRWGVTAREGNHGNVSNWRGEPEGDNYFSFFKGKLDKEGDEFWCDGDWDNVMGALDFIKSYDGDKPLCIYLPLTYPHPPYCVEEPWFSMTDREKIPPRAHTENMQGKPAILKGIIETQNMHDWTEERWTELRATYYGMCSRLDHQFDLLMQSLKDKEMYDDSAVFLFSDHGDYTGDFGIVEKTQNTFEDVLARVPLVVKPPKGIDVKPGVRDTLAELVDFPATVFELTGIKPDYDHFGKSLLPVLADENIEHRDAAFCEGGRLEGEVQAMERDSTSAKDSETEFGLYYPRMKQQISDEHHPAHGKATMCRTLTHKYIRRHYELDELYDLKKDPLEENNVINNPAYADVLAKLQDRMLTWYMHTCDVVPQITDNR